MKMKFFTLANIAAMSMCLMACNNTTTSTNNKNNNTKELESTSTEVSSADQTVSDTSTNNTTVSSDTNLDNSTHDKMIKTYQDALNQVINNNILPNGTQLNADGCINPITDNYFSIYDSNLWYLFVRRSCTIVSTWLGCSTKNILNPYCTREWWNAPFSLKSRFSSL